MGQYDYQIDPEADKDAEIYPCIDCGKLRSFNQGASVFTVCDDCWDKAHPPSEGE